MTQKKVPKKFKADNGKVFEVVVKKTNISSFLLELVGTGRTIKVRKASEKIIYGG